MNARFLPFKWLLSSLLLVSHLAWSANDKAFFYEVQGESSSLYLFGSVHLADDSFYPLRAEVEQAFAASDRLVVEVNPLTIDSATVQAIAEMGYYPPGENLADHLGADQLEFIKSLAASFGIPDAMFLRMRAGMVLLTVQQIQLQQMGYEPSKGIDVHFLVPAMSQQKPVVELETVLEQMELLMNLGTEEQVVKAIKQQLEQGDEYIAELFSLWKQGDETKMEKLLISDELDKHPEYLPIYNKLFFNRNTTMSRSLDALLHSEPGISFVVVGAGHLLGETGIVEQLRAKGYRITRR